MSRPPSNPPPPEEPVVTLEKQPDSAVSVAAKLGLSKAQYDKAAKAMSRIVWKVGCPVHVQLRDVVHDAFVLAAAKPISERPSIKNWGRFVAWLCAVTKGEALTNRKSKHRVLLGQGHSEDEVAALILAEGHAEALETSIDLHKAFLALKPADQELLTAIFVEDKSISEIAVEKKEPRSTVNSRYQRALVLLRAALSSVIAAIVLLVSKNARAQSLRLAQHVARLIPHATHTACAMTVTVACGVMVPASSMALGEHQEAPGTTLAAVPRPTLAAPMVPKEPSSAPEVEPEKPIALDEVEKQWSADDMKATTIARYLQATMFPFAFLIAPAVSQVACAGVEHRTPPPQEPEERDDSTDPYVGYCEGQRRLGGDCESRADWCASMGQRPAPGPKGCE
jgi:RNA polymerase sigma factor (sigma-70 family)